LDGSDVIHKFKSITIKKEMDFYNKKSISCKLFID
jgi:hypothetical protein